MNPNQHLKYSLTLTREIGEVKQNKKIDEKGSTIVRFCYILLLELYRKSKKRSFHMIQDIEPYCYSNAYNPASPEADSYLLYYQAGEVLVHYESGIIQFPRFRELVETNPYIYESYIYLFSIDKDRFYLTKTINIEEHSIYKLEKIPMFRSANPKHLSFAGITGYQLYRWYQSRQYCGSCGQPMQLDRKERMLHCSQCDSMEYPKISPAVIVGVTDGNRILLSKYAGRDYKKYALLAGFAEIGESIEDTVKREVMEEVGIKVQNITYYKSQPWSFSDTLLLGFFAELDGDPTITLEQEELAMARWFEREEIPVEEQDLSLTNEMIMKFKNQGFI